MGNRAFIKFKNETAGIYLHWNGGRDSVEAFLRYCELKKHRSNSYGIARMAQVIGNYFGGTLSLGIEGTIGKSLSDLCPGDNGVYVVDDWHIVGRYPRNVAEQHNYDLVTMLIDIDNAQPAVEQLGEEFIRNEVEKKGE